MKKVKKYDPGVSSLTGNTYSTTGGWNYGFGGNSGIVNPGNTALQQYTTTSPNTIPTGEEPTSGNISQLFNNPSKKSSLGFEGFMGKYGNLIGDVSGNIAMLINANKKQDPTGRPYKTGTKNLNTNMKKRKSLIKYEGGVEDATLSSGLTANYAEAQQMKANAEDRKRAFLQKNIESESPMDMRRVSATSTVTPTNEGGPRTSQVTQAKRRTGSDKVRAYQQKLKDAGYNITVDGIWGKETQRIHNAYTSKNTTQQPAVKKPVRTEGDWQQMLKEMAPTRPSMPAATPENRFTFNVGDKGKGQDVTALQNQNKIENNGFNINTKYNPPAYQGENISGGGFQDHRTPAQKNLVLKQKTVEKPWNVKVEGQGQSIYPTEWRNRLIPDPKDNRYKDEGASSLKAGKKPTMYERIDARLGGILPGGLNRKESKELRVANRAQRLKEKIDELKNEYSSITGKQDSDLIKYSEYGPYGDKYRMPEAPEVPKTKVDEMIQQSTVPPPAKTETKIETPANTVVKKSPSKNQKRKGGSEKTSVPTESSLFKNGVAIKNFKDKKTGRFYYTNGRVFDEKTGKMGKYTSDNKTVKFSWDEPKATPKNKNEESWYNRNYTFGKEPGVGKAIGYVMSGFQDSPGGYSINPLQTLKNTAAMYLVGRLMGGGSGAKVPKGAPAPRVTPPKVTNVNAPGAMSKVVPTRQSSNIGKIPTKTVRGEKGRFTENPSRKPVQTSPQLNPDNIRGSFKKGTTPSAATNSAPAPKLTFKEKARAAGGKTKEVGKAVLEHLKRNPKKYASAAALVGTGYLASKMRTGEQ